MIFKKLGPDFSFDDLLNLFNNEPELLQITQSIIQKWQLNYKKNITNFSLRNENE